MLYKRLDQRHDICVLSVNAKVIDAAGAVITDQNAASKYVRFGAGASGLEIVDRAMTFAEYWTSDDPVEQFRRRAAKCAEVLVPNRIDSSLIQHAYVCSGKPGNAIKSLNLKLSVVENPLLFFGYL